MKIAHIHVHARAADCDGPIERHRIMAEYAGETGRLAWTQWVAFQVRYLGPYETMKRDTEHHNHYHIEFGGPTEEGYSYTEAWTCEGCTEGPYNRDLFAEMAGY